MNGKQGVLIMFLVMLATGLAAQNLAQHHTQKGSLAFINIAYLDAKNKAIDANYAKQFSKAFSGFGDRSLIEDMTVRLFLEEELFTGDFKIDSTKLTVFNSCPKISPYPIKNACLVALYSMPWYINKGNGDVYTMYKKYLNWQKDSMPNAPVGINDANGLTSMWGLKNTYNWVVNYPVEFNTALKHYNADFNTYNNTHKDKLTPADFFKTAIDSLGYYTKDEMEAFVTDDFLSYNQSTGLLPTKEYMDSKPREFITTAFETIYMRKPTADELADLTKYIQGHPALTPKIFYYSLMTSEEYKHY